MNERSQLGLNGRLLNPPGTLGSRSRPFPQAYALHLLSQPDQLLKALLLNLGE